MPTPKPTEFLLSTPLYAKTFFAGDEVWDILDIIYYGGTYDSYCTKCRRESTFQVTAPERPKHFVQDKVQEASMRQLGMKIESPTLKDGIYIVRSCCTRTNNHTQAFVAFVETELVHPASGKAVILRSLQKIGQQPSYGDVHLAQTKKYTHVLSASQLGELTRAIGLASHDVGVGSYVYLRRIFESLVEDAHKVAVDDSGWNEDIYQRSRMNDRISLLKTHLPTFLVEHPGMYSLLSKGIHELSEDECLKHFETLRIGIELILDERLEARERTRKISSATAAIQKAMGEAGA